LIGNFFRDFTHTAANVFEKNRGGSPETAAQKLVTAAAKHNTVGFFPFKTVTRHNILRRKRKPKPKQLTHRSVLYA